MLSATKIAEIIGIVGAVLYLLSYAILQRHRNFAKSAHYSIMNALAALAVLYSLFYYWNLPSVIIQVFWFGISIYGIYRCFSQDDRD